MGANVSSTVNKVDNEAVVSAINKTLNTFTSKTENRNKITQTRNLNLANATVDLSGGCSFNANQKASIETELVADMDAEAQTAATNEATNDVMAKLKEDLEMKNQDFNLFQANVSSTSMDTRNRFEAELKNIIENSISSVVSSTNDVFQSDNLDASGAIFNCKDGGEINFNQEATIKSTVESNNNFSAENSSFNQAKNKLVAELETKKKMTNVGLNPFMMLFIALGFFAMIVAKAYLGRKGDPQPSGRGSKWALIILGILLMLGGAGMIAASKLSFDKADESVEPFDIDNLRPIAYINGGLLNHEQMKTLKPGQMLSSEFRQRGYPDVDKPIYLKPSDPSKGELNVVQRVDGINGKKSTNWYIPVAPEEGENPKPVILVGDKIDAIREDYLGKPLPFIGPDFSIPLMVGGIVCLFLGFSMLSYLAYGGRSMMLGRGLNRAAGATGRGMSKAAGNLRGKKSAKVAPAKASQAATGQGSRSKIDQLMGTNFGKLFNFGKRKYGVKRRR